MSYKSFSVNINNVINPYVNSTVEVGYFNGVSNSSANWYTQPAVTLTTNGIATTSSDGGLIIINEGIYRLSVSLDLYEGGNAGSPNTIQFAFGTSPLGTNGTSSPTNLLGGSNGIYTKAFSSSNTINPGIISWLVSSGSSINTTPGKFDFINNQLVYNFYNQINNEGEQYQGICTSELVFTLNTPNTAIYLNASESSGQFFYTSYFVLNMISSTPIPQPPSLPT
jgi:hypothetical protein